MNIRRRLQISNLLMIGMPAAVALVVGIALIVGAWVVLTGGGLGRSDVEDFAYEATAASELAASALSEKDAADATDKTDRLEKLLAANGLAVRAFEGDSLAYQKGTLAKADQELAASAASLAAPVNITTGDRALSVRSASSGGHDYTVYLYGNIAHGSKSASKAMVFVAVAVLAGALISAIVLANRFLTNFVLRRITEPLDDLAVGVRHISQGELAFRLDAARDDEFAPVYADFNDMAARLEASVERDRRMEAERRDLVVGLSHDLKSPLTSIQAYAEGLLDGIAQTPEAANRYLATIRDKAIYMRGQLGKISLVFKMEQELDKADLEVCDLGAFADEWAAENADAYRLLGVEIATHTTPAAAKVDRALLARSLANLLDNCAKYARDGRKRCSVNLVVDADATGARVTVADDGPGVAEEDLPRIFDLFFRADEARTQPEEGSGVGLAAVKRAMELMGGSVEAASRPGEGLAVTLRFAPVTIAPAVRATIGATD